MANSVFPFRLREPRAPLAFPVLVQWKDELRRHVARNISDSGIFIDADPPYPIGAVVRVIFMYPGTDIELTAVGEVRHQDCHEELFCEELVNVMGVGIEFLRFEDGVVKASAQLMAS